MGPFQVVQPSPSELAKNHGRSKNYVWLALPITLGAIRKPLNLSHLHRFVERPAHLGGTDDLTPVFSLTANWGRQCGKHIEKIHFEDLEEFCVGHKLE